MSNLEFTGERLVPGIYGKIAAEHLHRYSLCIDFVIGKKVLDIASGEGYGSNLLSEKASEVLGVDLSQEAINHAVLNYSSDKLKFIVGNVLDIPSENGVFDVVVSFETLEHISDHKKMISEIKRVLKPEGVLIISTPEKSFYSDRRNYSNPFHEKELYEEEFVQILNEQFQFIQLGYQKFLSGSYIYAPSEAENKIKFFEGNYNGVNIVKDLNQEYLLAICSNKELELSLNSTFFTNDKFKVNEIEERVVVQVKKFRSGFRYRLADFIFKPWDILKQIRK